MDEIGVFRCQKKVGSVQRRKIRGITAVSTKTNNVERASRPTSFICERYRATYSPLERKVSSECL